MDRHTYRSGWRKWTPRYPRQLGYRGSVLLTFGAVWILLGMSISEDRIVEGVPHLLIPGEIRTILWVTTGVLAILAAWRPPGFNDAFGWAALYLMPAVRTISYAIAWSDSWLPTGGEGYAAGWKFALIYFVMVAAVWICSGWAEPPARRARPKDDKSTKIPPAGLGRWIRKRPREKSER